MRRSFFKKSMDPSCGFCGNTTTFTRPVSWPFITRWIQCMNFASETWSRTRDVDLFVSHLWHQRSIFYGQHCADKRRQYAERAEISEIKKWRIQKSTTEPSPSCGSNSTRAEDHSNSRCCGRHLFFFLFNFILYMFSFLFPWLITFDFLGLFCLNFISPLFYNCDVLIRFWVLRAAIDASCGVNFLPRSASGHCEIDSCVHFFPIALHHKHQS